MPFDELEQAKVKISNAVYEASIYFESLENQGKIVGNGHHMAQKVAQFAQDLLAERWINKIEK